jgi:hypothetical protein
LSIYPLLLCPWWVDLVVFIFCVVVNLLLRIFILMLQNPSRLLRIEGAGGLVQRAEKFDAIDVDHHRFSIVQQKFDVFVSHEATSLRLNDVIEFFQANFELGLVIRVAIREAE